jgi:hypothetical protein
MEPPGLEQGAVSRGAPDRTQCLGFMIPEVSDVAMIEVEFVMPRGVLGARLPGARPDNDRRPTLIIAGGDWCHLVDPPLQHHPQVRLSRGSGQVVPVEVSLVYRLERTGPGVPNGLSHLDKSRIHRTELVTLHRRPGR